MERAQTAWLVPLTHLDTRNLLRPANATPDRPGNCRSV